MIRKGSNRFMSMQKHKQNSKHDNKQDDSKHDNKRDDSKRDDSKTAPKMKILEIPKITPKQVNNKNR
jgi:hypothetical protein